MVFDEPIKSRLEIEIFIGRLCISVDSVVTRLVALGRRVDMEDVSKVVVFSSVGLLLFVRMGRWVLSIISAKDVALPCVVFVDQNHRKVERVLLALAENDAEASPVRPWNLKLLLGVAIVGLPLDLELPPPIVWKALLLG